MDRIDSAIAISYVTKQDKEHFGSFLWAVTPTFLLFGDNWQILVLSGSCKSHLSDLPNRNYLYTQSGSCLLDIGVCQISEVEVAKFDDVVWLVFH